MNWNAFIAGMCIMSIFFNITESTSIFNYEDFTDDMCIYNIIIFIIIMVISIAQVIKV